MRAETSFAQVVFAWRSRMCCKPNHCRLPNDCRLPNHRCIFVAAAILLGIFCGVAETRTVNGQSFQLVEPSGQVTGKIRIDRGLLTFFDAGGQPITYVRDRRYDSRGGDLIGFYNAALARILKFPRSGLGQFLYADLDEFAPRDRLSVRSVRPIGHGHPVNPPHRGLFADAFTYSVPLPNAGAAFIPPIGQLGPQSTLIESKRVALPAIEPVELTLLNGGDRAIQVTLFDAKRPGKKPTFQIHPGQSETIRLPRDASERLVQTYEVITPGGAALIQEKTRLIAPPPRYQITVHQWRVQSVSIDRTVAGQNRIDDVNVQGQPVGSFRLPPGSDLQSGTIDVFTEATAALNQGAFQPILSERKSRDSMSPLERQILDSR